MSFVAIPVRIEHYHIRVVLQDLNSADHLAAKHAGRPVRFDHTSPLQLSKGKKRALSACAVRAVLEGAVINGTAETTMGQYFNRWHVQS